MVDLARPGPGDAPDGRETDRRTLRVLAVEDNETDLELLLYELGRCGVPTDTTWVVDAAGLRSALRSPADLVIADYSVPGLDVPDTIRIVREHDPDVPIIVVSGVMDEATCVAALRLGAADYLLKDRLSRLGPAVSQALDHRDRIVAQRQAEDAARQAAAITDALVRYSPLGVYVTAADGRVLLRNETFDGIRDASDDVGATGVPRSFAARDSACRAARLPVEADEQIGDRTYRSLRFPLPGPDGGPVAVAATYVDVTAQHRLAEEEAELHRLRASFVANVTHEIRTPLASICGYAELLAGSEAGELNPAAARAATAIERNALRLHGLISDLLILSGLEPDLAPRAASSDLADVVGQEVDAVRGQPFSTRHRFELRLSSPAPARGDKAKLQRAIHHLLTNAVKHTPALTRIRVSLDTDRGQTTLTIDDNGPGMPETVLQHLESTFVRADEADREVRAGAGIGLPLAHRIVRGQGGDLAVSSSPDGTVVRLCLPAE